MATYLRFVLRHRVLVLLVVAGVTAAAGASLSRGVVRSSVGGLFLGEHPGYPEYLQKVRSFGNDDVIVVAVRLSDPLKLETQKRLRRITRRISRIPSVVGVRSVLDAQNVHGSGETLHVDPYATLARKDPVRAMAALQADPLARGVFVSPDGRLTTVLVELDSDPARPAENLPGLLDALLAAFAAEGISRDRLHVVGLSASIGAVIAETYGNLRWRFPVSAVVLLFAVWLLFRRLWPVVVSGTVTFVAVIWTMGLSVQLDREISVFSSLVPAVILIVGFSDVVHLCSAYLLELSRGRTREEAILAAAREVGAACLLTSATTFAGFLSLSMVPTPASRHLGVVLGSGTAMALLLAMTLTPVLLSYLPTPTWRCGVTARVQDLLDHLLVVCGHISSRRPYAVCLAFVLFLLPVGLGLARLTIESDFPRRLSDGHPLRKDDIAFRAAFPGTNTLYLFVRTPGEGGLFDPETFHRVVRLQERLKAMPGVQKVVSLVDLMERLHLALGAKGGLPRSREALSQYLLLFEMSGGSSLERMVDPTRREMLLRVQLETDEFRRSGELGERAAALGREVLGDRAAVTPSGLTYLLGQFFNVILDGQRKALLVTFLAIALMMALGLRSLRAGLWSMVPNVLPLVTLGGYLGLAWDYVDSDVLIVAMIAIGIGVDDTIHFLMRYRIESRRHADPEKAIAETFAYSGRGIVMTTIILVLGFLPFATSDYLSVSMLGTLLPLTLIVALAADLLLTPALARLGLVRF